MANSPLPPWTIESHHRHDFKQDFFNTIGRLLPIGPLRGASAFPVGLPGSGQSAPGATDHDRDLAIAEQRSKPGDMDCERRPNPPHIAVIPPSTNSRAPVT
jgi:hypothetical protein